MEHEVEIVFVVYEKSQNIIVPTLKMEAFARQRFLLLRKTY